MKTFLLLLASLLAGFSLQAQTELLTNTGMDFNAGGWTITGNVSLGSMAQCGRSAANFSGGNATPNGILSQTVTTRTGDTLRLTMRYGGTSICPSPARADVEFYDVNTGTQIFSQRLSNRTLCSYRTFTTTIVAPSPNIELRITDRTPNSTSCDFNIDNTSLLEFQARPNSIPTMSQWGLIVLCLSLLSFGAVMLHNKKRHSLSKI